MCTDLARWRAFRQTCHKLFIRIGDASLKRQTPELLSEPVQVPHNPPAPIEMVSWQFPEHDVPSRFPIPELDSLFAWVASLHSDGPLTQRWSWRELYVDACLQCPDIGPWYDSKRHFWQGVSAPDVPFHKRARSFSKFLTQYAKHDDFKLLALPASAYIAFWTTTLPVCTDSWLGVHISAAPLAHPIFDVFLDGCPFRGQFLRFLGVALANLPSVCFADIAQKAQSRKAEDFDYGTALSPQCGAKILPGSTSKSAPGTPCFNNLDFEIALSPQHGANFAELNFQKCSEPAGFNKFDFEIALSPNFLSLRDHETMEKQSFSRRSYPPNSLMYCIRALEHLLCCPTSKLQHLPATLIIVGS